MISTVYEATLRGTDRSYVGMTSRSAEERWQQHVTNAQRRPKGKVERALRQHGVDAFDLKVRAQLPTYEEAQIAERILIATEEPFFNATRGGEGRLGLSHPVSAEARKKIGDAHRGKSVSEKTRQKLSISRKADLKNSERLREMSASLRGTTLSAEHRQAVSEGLKGRKHSEETRAKMRAARQAWWARQAP